MGREHLSLRRDRGATGFGPRTGAQAAVQFASMVSRPVARSIPKHWRPARITPACPGAAPRATVASHAPLIGKQAETQDAISAEEITHKSVSSDPMMRACATGPHKFGPGWAPAAGLWSSGSIILAVCRPSWGLQEPLLPISLSSVLKAVALMLINIA